MGFYSWLLLFPAALTGMSRLFYQRWSIRLQNGFNVLGLTWISRAYFAVMLALAGSHHHLNLIRAFLFGEEQNQNLQKLIAAFSL